MKKWRPVSQNLRTSLAPRSTARGHPGAQRPQHTCRDTPIRNTRKSSPPFPPPPLRLHEVHRVKLRKPFLFRLTPAPAAGAPP